MREEELDIENAEQTYTSLPELLRSVSQRAKELDHEADVSLAARDLAGVNDASRRRAELLASLREAVTSIKTQGVEVPQSAEVQIAAIAGSATHAIESGRPDLAPLLYRRGDKIGDPDELERLASQIEGTQLGEPSA